MIISSQQFTLLRPWHLFCSSSLQHQLFAVQDASQAAACRSIRFCKLPWSRPDILTCSHFCSLELRSVIKHFLIAAEPWKEVADPRQASRGLSGLDSWDQPLSGAWSRTVRILLWEKLAYLLALHFSTPKHLLHAEDCSRICCPVKTKPVTSWRTVIVERHCNVWSIYMGTCLQAAVSECRSRWYSRCPERRICCEDQHQEYAISHTTNKAQPLVMTFPAQDWR